MLLASYYAAPGVLSAPVPFRSAADVEGPSGAAVTTWFT
jgi:hypothetical protein